MALHLVVVGRVAHAGVRAGCEDYAARVRRVWPLDIHEVRSPAGRYPPAERLRREGERLLSALPDGALAVAVTRTGLSETSFGLARRIGKWQASSRTVAFVIGGADGLDRGVHARCELALSLSPLTFPHELARLILLEQLYRATQILRGTPYHKGQ